VTRAPKQVWHRGASRLSGPDGQRALDDALACGVNMVEIDVVGLRGRLLVAHTRWAAWRHHAPALHTVLARLSEPRFAGVEFNVDVKRPGYERELIAALRRAGLLDRCLLSSQHARCLDRLRALDPTLRVGISVGGRISRARHRWRANTLHARLSQSLTAGRFHALMANHRLVGHELAEMVHGAGAELYAWTVNDAEKARRLRALGIAGVISDDLLALTTAAHTVS
jgi:glycerophosphoryl diester phosphodiesterase